MASGNCQSELTAEKLHFSVMGACIAFASAVAIDVGCLVASVVAVVREPASPRRGV